MPLIILIEVINPKYLTSYLISTLKISFLLPTQPAFTCSKLTMETLEQGVKYVQS